MGWQNKGNKMAMGKFVRVKSERMVLIRFEGEPTEAAGKAYDGTQQDQLHFPVTFWDERSVTNRYVEGEAATMVNNTNGDAKIFSVAGGPLLRELLAEDREESIIGRTFIVSHTGTARDTVYKFREVKVLRQAKIAVREDEEIDSDDDFNPRAIAEAEDQEIAKKAKFMSEVVKRTRTRKPKVVTPLAETATPAISDVQ